MRYMPLPSTVQGHSAAYYQLTVSRIGKSVQAGRCFCTSFVCASTQGAFALLAGVTQETIAPKFVKGEAWISAPGYKML